MPGGAAPSPAKLFAAGGGLMVLTLVVGFVLLFSGGPDRQVVHPAAAAPQQSSPAAATPPPSDTPEPTPKPEPQFRCFDDRVIDADQRCPVQTEAAEFAAFGLDRSSCRAVAGGPHNRWNYECRVRGVDVHLATYVASLRSSRLSQYGVQQDLGHGRVLAGGPGTRAGRWLRTYHNAAADQGLLMYASVGADDPYEKQVLMSLAQRFARPLLHGERVAAP